MQSKKIIISAALLLFLVQLSNPMCYTLLLLWKGLIRSIRYSYF